MCRSVNSSNHRLQPQLDCVSFLDLCPRVPARQNIGPNENLRKRCGHLLFAGRHVTWFVLLPGAPHASEPRDMAGFDWRGWFPAVARSTCQPLLLLLCLPGALWCFRRPGDARCLPCHPAMEARRPIFRVVRDHILCLLGCDATCSWTLSQLVAGLNSSPSYPSRQLTPGLLTLTSRPDLLSLLP
jgi:hypothetical protein